jgi:superfamily II DNA or RNA helicase
MADTMHKSRFGYFPEVCVLGEVLSHGQVLHAVREARAHGLQVQIVDPTPRYTIETGPIPPDYLPGVTGRDYQLLASQIALGFGHGIIKIGTGGGKNYCAGVIVKTILEKTDCKGVMILIMSKDLLNQMADRFASYGVPSDDIGIIHSGISAKEQQKASEKRVVLSTHLSIIKFKGVIQKTEYVICDECFPSGTMVGNRKIEDLEVGDSVPSFDESSQSLVYDIVINKFCRKPSSLVTVKTESGDVICTKDHPFWTKNGWVVASELKPDMFVAHENDLRHLRHGNREASQMGRTSLELREVQKGKAGKVETVFCGEIPLSGVFKGSSDRHSNKKAPASSEGLAALQPGMHKNSQDENIGSTIGGIQQKICIQKDERKQSDEIGGDQEDCFKNPQGYWSSPTDSRREREASTDTTTKAFRLFGERVVSGVPDKHQDNQQSKGTASSDMLQGGCSKPRNEGGDRGGWNQSLLFENTRERHEKDEDIVWVRVDGVEVHQPGSDGTFGGRCPDGNVYNIETEKFHTYTANGFIVHNCHRSTGPLWSALFPILPNLKNVLGLTATPWDTDEERHKMLAIYGQILVDIPVKWLIEKGYLLKPDIFFIRLYYKDKNNEAISHMGWREAEKQFILEEENRNLLPCVVLKKYGGRMLVIYDKLEHGERLEDLYIKHGFPTRLAEGKTSTAEREDSIKWFEKPLEDGEHGKVLLASRIFDEGVDIRGGCDLGFLIGAGKDPSRAKQRLGRLLRMNSTGHVKVFDAQDSNHPILSRWSSIRRKAIKEESGITPKVIGLDAFRAMTDPESVVSEESE